MNRIALYILLVLLFLGMSKSFSPTEQKTQYLANEQVYSHFFKGSPLTVVLEDAFTTGLFIKTYFMKLKLIHGFKKPESLIIRVSREFWNKNVPYIGLSLFRRGENSASESSIPMPPGALYLGNPAYGEWRMSNSGEKVWKFHRAYRNYPQHFGWTTFRATYEFHEEIKRKESLKIPFLGLNNEFGVKGEVTKKYFPAPLFHTPLVTFEFLPHLKKMFSLEKKRWSGKKEE